MDQNQQTLLIAHRGLTSEHLENTLEAFAAAFDASADGVEFDVQMSRDGVPMITHDKKLKRLFGVDKNITDLTAAELKELDQGAPQYSKKYKMPTLEEVLNQMPDGALVNVEVKETALEQDGAISTILSHCERHQARLNIVVSSFLPGVINQVREENGEVTLALLLDSNMSPKIYSLVKDVIGKVDYLNPHIDLMGHRAAQWLNDYGIPLITWGHERMGGEEKIINAHHYGLISDVVDELVARYKKQ